LAVLPDFKLRYSQISQKISQNWQRISQNWHSCFSNYSQVWKTTKSIKFHWKVQFVISLL